MMGQRHISDDRLVEVCLDASAVETERQHLYSCPDCQARCTSMMRTLTEVTDAAIAEADAAFPADRLARQQARILQRIEHEGRPARVIAFPAGHAAEAFALRTRPAMRWIAGAAAAGLVIGVLAGHLAHDFSMIAPVRASRIAATAVRPVAAVPTLQAVATTISEDDFLGQVDVAIEEAGSTSLRPLDDLTPRVWEVTVP